jgi:outer membrane protein assembly factor BamB
LVVGPDGIYAAETFQARQIVKLSRETLELEWRVDAGGAEPVLSHAHLLLVGSLSKGLAMIDGRSGRFLWQVEPPHWTGVLWRGSVAVSGLGCLQLLDLDSGRSRETVPLPTGWRYRGGEVLWNRVFCAVEDERLGLFDLSSRRAVWERDLLAEIRQVHGLDTGDAVIGLRGASSPDRFIATRGGSTFGCSMADGSLLWRAPVALGDCAPLAHRGRLYGPVLDRFIAVDEGTGEIVYDVKHPELAGAFYPKAGTIHAGKMAVAHESGHLGVFDLADGRLVWHYKSRWPLWGTAEADGRLLVTCGDGNLLVFEDKSAPGKKG